MRHLFHNTVWIATALLLTNCTAARVVTHTPSDKAQNAKAGQYSVDPDHRSLIFKVEHLGFSQFVGRFDVWEATLDFNPQNPTASTLHVTIDANSLSTPSTTMTDVVKGDDMLNVTEHPEINFTLKDIDLTGANTGQAQGILTMTGESAPVTFDITFNGAAKNPINSIHTLGFAAKGRLNRRDFGLSAWPIVVANEVHFEIDAEFRHVEDVANLD